MNDLRTAVRNAIRRVYDPCSLAHGRPMDLDEMGMLLDVGVEGRTARVTLTTTGPGCLMVPRIAEAVDRHVRAVDGIEEVVIVFDADHLWTAPRRTHSEDIHLLAARFGILPRGVAPGRNDAAPEPTGTGKPLAASDS